LKIQTKAIQKFVGISKKTERVTQLSDTNITGSLKTDPLVTRKLMC